MTGWVVQLLVVAGLVQGQPEVIVLPPAPPEVEVGRTQVDAWIEKYAGQYGVAAETLRYMAKCESTFNPKAVNGPYGGIYQYSASSWGSNRKVMGENPNPDLRFDAQEAIKTTAFIVSTRGGGMWPNCMPK